jgi:hypothetical protein
MLYGAPILGGPVMTFSQERQRRRELRKLGRMLRLSLRQVHRLIHHNLSMRHLLDAKGNENAKEKS